MKHKKLTALLLTAVLTVFCVIPAGADEIDLDDSNPASDSTEVVANVSNTAPGSPTYIISVPAKIDFGTLRQPQTSASSPISVPFQIKAELIDGLSSGSVIAVLMKDTVANGSSLGFTITGQTEANAGKSLDYKVIITNDDGEDIDITTRTFYDNGYAVYGFSATGQTKNGTAVLDQAQLYGKTLAEWAGSYKGNIHFYSTIATPVDFMLSN